MSEIFPPDNLETKSRLNKSQASRTSVAIDDSIDQNLETESSGFDANVKQTSNSSVSSDHESKPSQDQNDQLVKSPSSALAKVMKRSRGIISSRPHNSGYEDSRFCSMCLANSAQNNKVMPNHNSKDLLISPCLCSGSKKYQHKRCIEDWIEQTGAASCPFCFVRYDYTRKRKSIWSYVKDCELEHDFLVSLGMLSFCLYLFIVGVCVCIHYLHSTQLLNDASPFENKTSKLRSWLCMLLFCSICSGTVILLVGMITAILEMVLRHYIRYCLWSRSHFSVEVRAYRLDESTG